MAHDRSDPSEQIPEADRLEQQAPLEPSPLTDPEIISTTPTEAEADEADRLEQHATVPDEDEADYPHQADEAGWP